MVVYIDDILVYNISMEEHVEHLWKEFQRLRKIKLYCRNLSLGLVTKARAYKSAGQEGSPGDTFHAPENAKECEGMNPHTHKGIPTLGIGVPMDSQIFIEQFQGLKLIGLKRSLYHWKALGTWMSEMGSHYPFGHLKHKLWSKQRPGIKLAV